MFYSLNVVRQPLFYKARVGCWHQSSRTIIVFCSWFTSIQLLSSGLGTHSFISSPLAYLLKDLRPKLKISSYLSWPLSPLKAPMGMYRLSLTLLGDRYFSASGNNTPSHQKFLTEASEELGKALVNSYSRNRQKSWSNMHV